MSDEEGTLPPPPSPFPPVGDAWSGAPPPPPSPTALVDPGQLRGLKALSSAVMVLIGIVAVINLASIPNDLSYIRNVEDIVDGRTPDFDEIENQEDLRGTFGAVTLVALLVAGVLWIVWQQRARKVATGLGAAGQRHTEPLAALGWLIPFANLVIPKQVTNDLWRASDPHGPPAMRIEGKVVSPFIDLWWVLWILGAVVGRLLLNTDQPDTFNELKGYLSSLRLELGATILTLIAAALGVFIVLRITERLLLRAQRHGITP